MAPGSPAWSLEIASCQCVWALEAADDGTRICHQINPEPHGWLLRLLARFLDFGKIHFRALIGLFDGLGVWLNQGNPPD